MARKCAFSVGGSGVLFTRPLYVYNITIFSEKSNAPIDTFSDSVYNDIIQYISK